MNAPLFDNLKLFSIFRSTYSCFLAEVSVINQVNRQLLHCLLYIAATTFSFICHIIDYFVQTIVVLLRHIIPRLLQSALKRARLRKIHSGQNSAVRTVNNVSPLHPSAETSTCSASSSGLDSHVYMFCFRNWRKSEKYCTSLSLVSLHPRTTKRCSRVSICTGGLLLVVREEDDSRGETPHCAGHAAQPK